jgi:CubicO group peptidase (beta-lactamase class C family)
MKMKKILLVLFFLLPNISFSQNIYFPPVGSQSWDTISPQSLGWCMDALDSLIDYVGDTHAKAFLILKDGKIVVEHYYGTFTIDSVWYWASAGKSLTSFLVGLAQEQGYLNINDSLPKYLGHSFTSCSSSGEDSIRIIHQLTMTSGFDESYGGSNENHCTDDSCLFCLASPGTRWSYHNAPYTMTHWVLDSATGMSVNAFKIINLNSSSGIDGVFLPVDYDQIYFSKARSFARFGLLILNKGIWNGDTIMHDSIYFHDMINTSQTLNLSYGYLWWLNGKASYRLPGSQFQFPGSLVQHAPSDMFAAMGKNDQMLNIVPGEGLIMVRMGNAMYSSFEVPNLNCDSIWIRLNNVLCNANSVSKWSDNNNKFSIYPNPVNDYIHLNIPDNESKYIVEIFNSLGNIILKTVYQNKINVNELASGIYFVQIHNEKEIYIQKFIKN